MFKAMLFVAPADGLLVLGARASNPINAGKLNAVMLNGGGNVSGTGKRVCVRKLKTGSHISNYYCVKSPQ